MVALIGAGAHGTDCAVIYSRVHGTDSLEIFDDDPSSGFPAPPDGLNSPLILGMYVPVERRKLAAKYELPGADPLVDPSVVMGPKVVLGLGVVVAPHATLLHSVTLGEHTHVNYMAGLTRCTVGDFTTISPGATICGGVYIGNDCFIGANSTICDRVSIGHNVIIAAGAIVPPESRIPDGTKVIGVWK